VFTLSQVHTRYTYYTNKCRFRKKSVIPREATASFATAGVPGAEVLTAADPGAEVLALPGFPGVLGAEGAEGGGEEPASDITPGVTRNG
jgi:hypothetical protein